MPSLDDIRTEYMRTLPDAYAGGPRVRSQTWQRIAEMIEEYATTGKPQPKPAGRKARTTGTD